METCLKNTIHQLEFSTSDVCGTSVGDPGWTGLAWREETLSFRPLLRETQRGELTLDARAFSSGDWSSSSPVIFLLANSVCVGAREAGQGFRHLLGTSPD